MINIEKCRFCANEKYGSDSEICDGCLSDPFRQSPHFVREGEAEIRERVEALAKAIGTLTRAGISISMARRYAEEILLHLDELEGKR